MAIDHVQRQNLDNPAVQPFRTYQNPAKTTLRKVAETAGVVFVGMLYVHVVSTVGERSLANSPALFDPCAYPKSSEVQQVFQMTSNALSTILSYGLKYCSPIAATMMGVQEINKIWN